MVTWDRVSRAAVLRAMRDYGRLGPERFFSKHGFGPTTTYEWPVKNVVTRRKRSWAQLMSSPLTSDLAPVTSRAVRPGL